MGFRIIGTGMYVPPKVVTNDDLAAIVETNDEWISHRVGVKRRHVSQNEFTSEMGCKAALNAINDSGVPAESIDMILSATVSGETSSPSVACMIQNFLGISCPALEISTACTGFLFLLETAAAYFSLRKDINRILVVGAERMSGVVDWSDRSTCVIFGDGSGAAVLERGDNYLDFLCNIHGGDTVIKIPHAVGKSPFFTKEQDTPFIHMQGQETFKYAVNAIVKDIKALLERNGLTIEDIAYIVPHQANQRILDFACQRLGISTAKMYSNIAEYGNTSSASVPIALDELAKSGNIKRGDKLILVAFGGGLSDAACLIEW